jgi:hypothetical protein
MTITRTICLARPSIGSIINQRQDQEDDNEGNERSDKNIHANPCPGSYKMAFILNARSP